jgi:hypothetical protein
LGDTALAMPLATRIFAMGSHEAMTSGVWNGAICVAGRLALRAASTIWLAATTPDEKKKSGVLPATTLPAMSRLPTRTTLTGIFLRPAP